MGTPVALHGFGGSNPLNFDVVQYASEADLPESAKENIIAVFTNVDITGWYFSATQHENMKQGEVWFFTGASSSVAFNALKENSIDVCPIYAKQHVNGELVSVEAKTYQNGKWVDWLTYMLSEGAFAIPTAVFTSKTSSRSESLGTGYVDYTATSSGGTYNLGVHGRITSDKIDLSNVKTIRARANITSAQTSPNSAGATIMVLSGTTYDTMVSKVESKTTGEQVIELDVSSLNGSYYVVFGAFAYVGASGDCTGKVRFYDVYW